MDWSRAKTLLILCFFVLDVFLLIQLSEKRQTDQYDFLNESTIEERLAAEEITYEALPKDAVSENYISGTSRQFDPDLLNELANQNVIINGNSVVSSLIEPYTLNMDEMSDSVTEFMNTQVVDGARYRFWSYNRETNAIILFQTYEGKTIYYNDNGIVILQLNEDNQVVSYQQTMLSDIEQLDIDEKKQQPILPAIEALKILFERNELPSGSHVSSVELGYYTLVPLSGGVQVFAPTWHVIVDNERNYFINAIEGQIQQMNDGNAATTNQSNLDDIPLPNEGTDESEDGENGGVS
ncbi:two-component system regulatory protein YycI [Aureibacillus halotolerans]|uniref:Regulatory protein YycI of two-component signal transduction system YycFG n=1 Tax=Aureibacillus halotolerans TaxID=1508390 RepID=A0A4R6TZP6_9BACI|nr:two-component system regulatory protein YycI [Aureibacillus halotolerans]TDQ38372.1 regulatory protein YycI of two-component signal transduction system YycFG [Aureibacillus halotolerans]